MVEFVTRTPFFLGRTPFPLEGVLPLHSIIHSPAGGVGEQGKGSGPPMSAFARWEDGGRRLAFSF